MKTMTMNKMKGYADFEKVCRELAKLCLLRGVVSVTVNKNGEVYILGEPKYIGKFVTRKDLKISRRKKDH